MNWDHISARTVYMMWRDERLWNVGVLKRVRLFRLVVSISSISTIYFLLGKKLYLS
jgi:hypothetical protein